MIAAVGLALMGAAFTWSANGRLALLAFGAVLVSVLVLYHRGALSGLRTVDETEFVGACVSRIGDIPANFLVQERKRLASCLGVPSRVIGADASVVDLMAAFSWFGLESMMLDGLHDYAEERLRGGHYDSQTPVCHLIAAAWSAANQPI